MTARTAIGLLHGGRAVLGVSMVVAPQLVGERWIGAQATTPQGQIGMRSLGAREIVVGLGAAKAARSGSRRAVIAWCAGLAACDIVDGFATAAAREDVPAGGGPTMAVAFGAAVAGIVLAARV
jgi:hypothetical protein